MTVLLTLDFPPETGGIQRYLHDIVVHTFTSEDLVITGKGTGPAVPLQKKVYPCRVQRIGFPGDCINKKVLLLPFFCLLLHHAFQKKKRLVLAGNLFAAVVPWMVSFLFRLEYHVFCYGTELLPLKKGSFRNRLWKAVLHKAARVYYLTGATCNVLTNAYDCTHCVQRVPKIDLPACPPSNNNRQQDCIRLLSVGRLVPHKGHGILVEAAVLLAESPAWHLTIVGDGPERQRIEAQVRSRSLESNITIRSDVSDSELPQLYQQADIFVFPSTATESGFEGFGIVLLEAMAYRVAIIASRSGGIGEVVEGNSAYAMLVPPGDANALAEAIQDLMGDQKKRLRMVTAAYDLLERRYVW